MFNPQSTDGSYILVDDLVRVGGVLVEFLLLSDYFVSSNIPQRRHSTNRAQYRRTPTTGLFLVLVAGFVSRGAISLTDTVAFATSVALTFLEIAKCRFVSYLYSGNLLNFFFSPVNHSVEDFPDNPKGVTFVGRPFPLSEAHEHFSRLRKWGLSFSACHFKS
jgi:hypothetical protein